jgi:hypothetical protein
LLSAALVIGSSIVVTANQQQAFAIATTHDQHLHGKYLHLTDIHMDKHYKKDTTMGSTCHREPNKHKHRKKKAGLLAGYWGSPGEDCDSPQRLVYNTIDTIAKEWKHQIDFIIWTGDNARHDGDALITRTKKEIVGYNVKVTELMKKAFALNNRTIPIVPVIGNNDIHPHNELRGMKDNPQLIEFSKIWKDFIPKDQVKDFIKGGYYAVDVTPGMRVLALNTLYFFGSNDVVNACSDKKSPGARHIKWLRKQLKKAREQKKKVIIIGHVAPTVKLFKDSCLDDYIKLSVKYSDIITGHMYGHSNMDHFQIISREFSNVATTQQEMEYFDSPFTIMKDKDRFISSLREQYRSVKKARNRDELVVVHVAPPMLPLFYPTFRINEYETDMNSPLFGNWLKYTQWFTNLTYWNDQRDPITGRHLPPHFEVEYSTDETYNMTDLTADSWLEFAERISKKKTGKEWWKMYLDHMFVKTNNKWYGQSVPSTPPDSNNSWWDWIKHVFDTFWNMLLFTD